VRSAPAQGSTFWFEIAAPAAEAPAAASADGDALLEGLHILVVEDNATNRMIATKMLEGLGARVETAEDGERGVGAVGRQAFDLILMDIQMPGIDGMEATRQIRALPGPVAGTPIIALTANVLRHQRDLYLAAGMDGVIGKPISPAVLLSEIARLAGGELEAESTARSA
jgi:CheY-like chemotaxis protein